MNLYNKEFIFALKETQKEVEFNKLSTSNNNIKYFIIITDDYSCFRRIVLLKKKSETEKAI